MKLIDLITKFHEVAHSTGVYPKCHFVEPSSYAELKEDLHRMGAVAYAQQAARQAIDSLRIVGVTIRPIPYVDDPKFKQLQAMARLAGAELSFGDQSLSWMPNPHAEFITEGGGWRYLPASACIGGESQLLQIDERGLPLEKLGAFTDTVGWAHSL